MSDAYYYTTDRLVEQGLAQVGGNCDPNRAQAILLADGDPVGDHTNIGRLITDLGRKAIVLGERADPQSMRDALGIAADADVELAYYAPSSAYYLDVLVADRLAAVSTTLDELHAKSKRLWLGAAGRLLAGAVTVVYGSKSDDVKSAPKNDQVIERYEQAQQKLLGLQTTVVVPERSESLLAAIRAQHSRAAETGRLLYVLACSYFMRQSLLDELRSLKIPYIMATQAEVPRSKYHVPVTPDCRAGIKHLWLRARALEPLTAAEPAGEAFPRETI